MRAPVNIRSTSRVRPGDSREQRVILGYLRLTVDR